MAATTQRHEIETWLGDDHGLTDDRIGDLARIADEIADRYPDEDDADERDAALTVAYRLMVEDPQEVIAELADELLHARIAEARALAGIRQGAHQLVDPAATRGLHTQAGYAQAAGVDRSAVREWLGL